MSARAASATWAKPKGFSTSAMRAESYTFIWQP